MPQSIQKEATAFINYLFIIPYTSQWILKYQNVGIWNKSLDHLDPFGLDWIE